MALCKALWPMVLMSAGCQATPPAPSGEPASVVAPVEERAVVRPSAEGTAMLDVGQVLEIALQGNASTGYAWEFVEDGAPVLLRAPPMPRPAPRDEDDGAKPPMIGGPSVRRWHFVGAQPGEATLRLAYRRPWEQEAAPVRTAVFKVVVRDAAPR